MNRYLLILPIALLVAASQVLIKLRSVQLAKLPASGLGGRVYHFAADPVVLSAYALALFASFAWLYVVAKLPLTIAFPIYIAVTFLMVVLGGWLFLGEALSVQKLFAMALILAGIALGLGADA